MPIQSATHGRMVAVAALLLIGVTWLLPPPDIEAPSLVLSGNHFRHDTVVAQAWLKAVRSRGDILLLGTSESAGDLHGSNYWHWLNCDPAFGQTIHPLAGAGRNPQTWLPYFTRNPDLLNQQQIWVYINPIYWSRQLNRKDGKYLSRYVGKVLLYSQRSELQNLGFWDNLQYTLRYAGDDGHAWPGYDLFAWAWYRFSARWSGLQPQQEPSACTRTPYPLEQANSARLAALQQQTDPATNLAHHLAVRDATPPSMPYSKAAYQEVSYTKAIAYFRDQGAKVTAILGPYNRRFMQQTESESVKHYDALYARVEKELESMQIEVVSLPPSEDHQVLFSDAMHHAAYGGWQIAAGIKQALQMEGNLE